MAIDTTGLLTGVLSPSQRSQQRLSNNVAQAGRGGKGAILAGGMGLANTMTDSLSNLIGADTRSPEQIGAAKVSELLEAGDTTGALKILRDIDPQGAMRLLSSINAEQERLAGVAKQEADVAKQEGAERRYLEATYTGQDWSSVVDTGLTIAQLDAMGRRGVAEKERLAGVAKQEDDALKQRGAQTLFISNRYPDKAMELTPLLDAGVSFGDIVKIAEGEKAMPLNREELTRMIAAQNPNLSPEELSRVSAQAWNARDASPTEPEEPPRIASPNSADLDLASQTISGLGSGRINAVIDNVGLGGSGVNNLTKDDLEAELALVIRNFQGRLAPQQLANSMLEYYSRPEAVENGFSSQILSTGTLQSGTESSSTVDEFDDL
tara:strand:+ start:1898 stop:3034 length:1137 start_codon:yes stop_codon:yes gene_type:complete